MAWEKAFRGLAFLYVLAIPFHAAITTRWFGSRFQPSEVVFLALAAAGLIRMIRERRKPRLPGMAAPVLALHAACAISWIASGFPYAGLLEWGALIYLSLLAALIATFYTPGLERNLLRGFAATAVWLGATVVAGGIFIAAGRAGPMFSFYEDYPYLGRVWRATSTFATPTMLAAYVVLLSGWWLAGRRPRLPAAAAFMAGAAAASKDLLGLAFAAALHRASRGGRRAAAVLASLILGWCLLPYFAPVLPSEEPAPAGPIIHRSLSSRIATPFGSITISPTNYLFLRLAEWEALRRSPWTGVGIGGFPHYLARQRDDAFLPPGVGDPHSIYWGAAAETGLAGLFSSLWMMAAWFALARRGPAARDPGVLGPWAAAASLFILGIHSDLLTFRGWWVVMGMVLGRRVMLESAHAPTSD